nr:hypothetical protein [Micromonospora sp. KC721]
MAALRRRDVDPRCRTLTVRATLVERSDGSLTFGPPKTDAGIRTVTIPDAIRRDIRAHLDDFVDEDQDALVFTGAKGGVLRRSNFQTASKWRDSVAAAGLPGFHFHDLRHTGQHPGLTDRGQPRRSDGPDGPRLDPGRADLPAHCQGARQAHR